MHTQESTLALIIDLQDDGWDIDKLPAFTTNCGWTISYSTDEMPGKVGFVMLNKDESEFAMIAGLVYGGRMLDTEIDASRDSVMEEFYQQFWIYCQRVRNHVPKHRLPRSQTDEKYCPFATTVFSKFFKALPVINLERRVKIGLNWYGLEIRRSEFGVGAFVLHSKNNGKFRVTFDNFAIKDYVCEGFSPQWVITYIRSAAKDLRG